MAEQAEHDMAAAVDMLDRLASVAPEKRMDTLVIVIKVFLEAGNRWSNLTHVWERFVRANELRRG